MDIKEKQDKLYEMLVEFDKLAKENNIKYFFGTGSALGAVREHDFIPWDGDIDVFMLYDDYCRCEQVFMHTKDISISWVSYKTDKKAPNMMGRIYKGGFDFDNLENYPYIDLFALSGAPDNSLQQKKVAFLGKKLFQLYWVKKRVYKGHMGRGKSRTGRLLQIMLFWYPKKFSEYFFEKWMTKWPLELHEYVFPVIAFYGTKEILPKQWFDEVELMSFRDIKVPVMSEWDKYLRHMYGNDYMIPKQYARYKQEG